MATNYDLLLNKMREIGMDYRWAGMLAWTTDGQGCL